MKVQTNTLNCAPNPNFQKRVSTEVKDEVERFKYMHKFWDQDRNAIARIWHFIFGMFSVIPFMQDITLAGKIIWGCNIIAIPGFDKLFHNIAIRKSQLLAKELRNKNKDDQFIAEAVDYYLKKNGGLIYSNFVRKFKKEDIQSVVKGEQAPQFSGIIPFVQTKLAVFSHNKPLRVKGRKNLKKYIHIK